MKSEYDLLRMLTLDQTLEHQQERHHLSRRARRDQKSPPRKRTEPSSEYLKAKQQILLAKATLQELSQDLRPAIPKSSRRKRKLPTSNSNWKFTNGKASSN